MYAHLRRHWKNMKADRKTTIESKVNRFLFTFRIALHTAAWLPPAKLMFKWRLRTTFHLMKPVTYRFLDYKSKMKQRSKVITLRIQSWRSDSGAEFWIWPMLDGKHQYQTVGSLGILKWTQEGDDEETCSPTFEISILFVEERTPDVQMDNISHNPGIPVVLEIPEEITEPDDTQMDDVVMTPMETGRPKTPRIRKSSDLRRPPNWMIMSLVPSKIGEMLHIEPRN